MGVDQSFFSYWNGHFTEKRRGDGKPTGMVVAIAEDAGQSLWIVTTGMDRLLRLDPKAGNAEAVPEERAPSRITSSSKKLVYLLSVPLGQISILHEGKAWEHVPLPTGLRTSGSLLAYGEDSLFGHAGFTRWRDRKWSPHHENGLPCEAVQDMSTKRMVLWLHLACGFAHITKRDVEAWSR
jgi:hypothetical protein